MDNNSIELEKEIQTLSHEDLCEITLSTLRRLVTSDKLLLDLPPDVTIEEVNSQIAVAQGQSITVTILRNSETPLQVIIPQRKCTVYDLKKAIQRSFELKQQRNRSRSKISWKYIWKTYNLRNNDYVSSSKEDENTQDYGPTMFEDHILVSNHGVKNKSKISFVKRLRNCDNQHFRSESRRYRGSREHRRSRSNDRSFERRERSFERRERSIDRSFERRGRSIDRSIERKERSYERDRERSRSIENCSERGRSIEIRPETLRSVETRSEKDRAYTKADPRNKNFD